MGVEVDSIQLFKETGSKSLGATTTFLPVNIGGEILCGHNPAAGPAEVHGNMHQPTKRQAQTDIEAIAIKDKQANILTVTL